MPTNKVLNLIEKLKYSDLAPGQLFVFTDKHEFDSVSGIKMIIARNTYDEKDTALRYIVLASGYSTSPGRGDIPIIKIPKGSEVTIEAG